MSHGTVPDKSEVRAAVRGRRRRRDPEQRAAASAALSELLIGLAGRLGARRIAAYSPVAGEPDVGAFTALAVSRGHEVLLPVSHPDRTLSWVRASAEAGAPGLHGIPEPLGERLPPGAIGTVDLVLVPACAVDERGVRLGWGLGYYDRALALVPPETPVFAVVHDDEVYPRLPAEAHDVPITGAVTPSGIREFPRASG
ncbi:5-formyltetrahydrofolate cyclo-ligase [Leucobacter sp. CSA2]|uniref:5-formyltetrahydrofolate cyclo-ligase n=1 Tax=Leucobacter edaphi TaxID=2796472 RepID=A0A934QCF6_9MICO|nr:5-formyltetrahydrofolate cyclo-ligase [Leucobacter edaphi]MBK0420517.1 5-formyltetrahydrofolate cyclo-ligase [Leucobacter edaphi]